MYAKMKFCRPTRGHVIWGGCVCSVYYSVIMYTAVHTLGVREDARAGGYLTTGRPSILFIGDNIPAYGFRRLNVLYNDRLSNTLRNTETHMLECYRQETR